MLSLAEDIFLLSLLERKDSIRIPFSLGLPYTLAGAVLMELIISGRAGLENGRLIPLIDPEQVAERPVRFALEKICQAEKPKRLDQWVYLLGVKGKRISRVVIQSLITKGLLVDEGKHFRWGDAQIDNVSAAMPYKYALKRDIRDNLFCGSTLDQHFMARLSLLESCDMLDHLFTQDEIVAVRKKIKTWREELSTPEFLELLNKIREAVNYALAAAVSS